MSRTRSLPMIEAIDGHLDKLQDAFQRVFRISGDESLFNEYWLIISPREFILSEVSSIDQYYDTQIGRIPTFLKARSRTDTIDVSDTKKDILKTLTTLCHKLARFKNAILKLAAICHPNDYAAACQGLRQHITADIYIGQIDIKFIQRETFMLENYFYLLDLYLVSLGYLKEHQVKGRRVQGEHTELPQLLRQQLDVLAGNKQLNEIIEQLETARKHKQPDGLYVEQLTQVINHIASAKAVLESTADQMLARYEQAAERVSRVTQNMTDRLQQLQQFKFIFILIPVLNELTESLYFSAMRSTVKSMVEICAGNRSMLNLATRGMIGDPWAEAEKVLTDLCQLENQIRMFVAGYTGGSEPVSTLHRQYCGFEKTVSDFTRSHQTMSENLQRAQQAKAVYLQVLNDTGQILQDHVAGVKAGATPGFGRRHWLKMFGGGISGAGIGTAGLLLTTNPLALAVFIVAGSILGTVGGAGGGLITDVIEDRRTESSIAKTSKSC